MRVLITGGAGFIGNSLARKLISEEKGVGLLIRKKSKIGRVSELKNQFTYLGGDLRDKGSLKRAISEYRPEMIYHFAAYGNFPKFQKNEEMILSTNVGGIINLVDAAKGVPILNFGSSSEYGIKEKPMTEETNCNPNNYYGKTKLMQTLYCQSKGIPTLRFFSVYGPLQKKTQLIPTIIDAKIKGKDLHLIDSVRDYVFIDDALHAIEKATEKYDSIKGEIFNLGTGNQITVKEIMEKIQEINATEIKINWDFNPVQEEPKTWVADISKIKKYLGWEPSTKISKGLLETYNWMEDQSKNSSQ
jgi:nucleoside-diphosphate-sugar epimerase